MIITEKTKKDFPIFNNIPNLVYLDSAATSQKPKQVISAITDFLENHNANVHRGIYDLSQSATDIFEGTRKKVANFVGARDDTEIVFTGNASEAINLAAFGYARKFLKEGDIVVISSEEHHSNFVPWLKLREEKGVRIFMLPMTSDFFIDYKILGTAKIDLKKIKLVAVTQASNVLGTINPVEEIADFLNRKKIRAKLLVDAAQSVPHMKIDVKKMGCDFLAFSGHKMLGPSGIGALWAKKEILEEMDPLMSGSNMISNVTDNEVSWNQVPEKFETGTGRLEGAAGLGAAIDYLEKIGMRNVEKYERELTEYLLRTLIEIPEVEIYGSKTSKDRLGVVAFNVKGVHSHDTGEILNRRNICVRTGHHCAMPLLSKLGVGSTVRASLYLYNNKKDIDKLAQGIKDVKKIFKHG